VSTVLRIGNHDNIDADDELDPDDECDDDALGTCRSGLCAFGLHFRSLRLTSHPCLTTSVRRGPLDLKTPDSRLPGHASIP